MKILLLNPPRLNELVGKNPAIIEKHRGFNPPLGLLYLAASIKKQTSYEVDVLDAQPLGWNYEELTENLRDKYYAVVGISTMSFTLIDAFKTLQAAKKAIPQAKIILGGTHVHLFPEETIGLDAVDFAFRGEAEHSLVEFLRRIEEGRAGLEHVPGLIFKETEGKIIKNDIRQITDLDAIPFPQRTMLNIRNYSSLLSRGSLCTTIVSSRGCPFQCAFCDRPRSPVTSHFRYRSAKNVVDEISECLESGIKDFLFYDDTFTVNRPRVLAICEEILRRRLKIRWDIRTRVDLVDEEMLRMLKRAGCLAIHYGVEAGNDKILRVIKKGFTIRRVKDVFRLTRRVGIETLAYFMIGLPAEDRADIQDTFDLARELRPDYAHFTIFSPYPGTELYALGLEKGIIKTDLWREFARRPKEGFRIPVWEENFTRDELYALIVKFYKRFYLRP
ncbi:MAG: B12-binding domain-containing radical SAM protein, partial [Candidatus Aminicenantes bacterium]|nr:B12-binding domain-containing radical SAM protein [Candidatus Aminicenantes bacterium]